MKITLMFFYFFIALILIGLIIFDYFNNLTLKNIVDSTKSIYEIILIIHSILISLILAISTSKFYQIKKYSTTEIKKSINSLIIIFIIFIPLALLSEKELTDFTVINFLKKFNFTQDIITHLTNNKSTYILLIFYSLIIIPFNATIRLFISITLFLNFILEYETAYHDIKTIKAELLHVERMITKTQKELIDIGNELDNCLFEKKLYHYSEIYPLILDINEKKLFLKKMQTKNSEQKNKLLEIELSL